MTTVTGAATLCNSSRWCEQPLRITGTVSVGHLYWPMLSIAAPHKEAGSILKVAPLSTGQSRQVKMAGEWSSWRKAVSKTKFNNTTIIINIIPIITLWINKRRLAYSRHRIWILLVLIRQARQIKITYTSAWCRSSRIVVCADVASKTTSKRSSLRRCHNR